MEYVLIGILGVAVGFVVQFFLIRSAVKSAISSTLLDSLHKIDKRLSAICPGVKPVGFVPAEDPSRGAGADHLASQSPNDGVAYLLKGSHAYGWKCSLCNEKQWKNVSTCIKCGAPFANREEIVQE